MLKTCNKCFEEKDVTLFYKRAANKDGLDHMCKACHNAYKATSFALAVAEGRVKPRKKDVLNAAIISGFLECIHCKQVLPLTDFKTDKNKRIGYRQVCRKCDNKYCTELFWSQPEDKIESRRDYARAFAKANRSMYTAQVAKRRQAQRQALPKWAEEEFEELLIQELYDKAKRLSDITGKAYHVDHIVPVQSKIVCGLHCFDNLQILLGSENISKSNRHWPDMP